MFFVTITRHKKRAAVRFLKIDVLAVAGFMVPKIKRLTKKQTITRNKKVTNSHVIFAEFTVTKNNKKKCSSRKTVTIMVRQFPLAHISIHS